MAGSAAQVAKAIESAAVVAGNRQPLDPAPAPAAAPTPAPAPTTPSTGSGSCRIALLLCAQHKTLKGYADNEA